MRCPLDILGRQFNSLFVLSYEGVRKGKHSYKCQCECGRIWSVLRQSIRSGTTKSCGCKRRKRFIKAVKKHGMHGTDEYSIWEHIIQRCTNPNDCRYRDYGGRGISVCSRWLDFKSFYEDMGARPGKEYSIGRIDNNGWYEPANCRWETPKEQSRNMRSNRTICFRGESRCVSEWAEILGINKSTLHKRLARGWSVERALAANGKI